MLALAGARAPSICVTADAARLPHDGARGWRFSVLAARSTQAFCTSANQDEGARSVLSLRPTLSGSRREFAAPRAPGLREAARRGRVPPAAPGEQLRARRQGALAVRRSGLNAVLVGR